MSAPFHVLIAEDDPHIIDILDYALRAQGYAVRSTARGAEAVALCTGAASPPDLLILDVGLPDIDGFEVCRQVRRVSEKLPILFLTSQSDEINRVVGLEIGGDDYITKPFSPRELVARVKAWRRRLLPAALASPAADGASSKGGGQTLLRHGPLEIDPEKFQARWAGAALILTRQEFRLLTLLTGSPGRVFTREQVLDRAWEDGGAVTDRAIDAHVKSLRRKLTEAGGAAGQGLIETVRGIGYRAREVVVNRLLQTKIPLPVRLPGWHSIHWKVFAFHLAVLVLPVGYLAWELRQSLETTHLQATEEGMIDTAAVASDLYARLAAETNGDPTQIAARFAHYLADFEGFHSAKARLFGFTPDEADTRLIFYDAAGRVLYDTLNPHNAGSNQSQNLEVRLALEGRYGSRWRLDRKRRRVFIYSTVPVWQSGRIVGAVSVVKPTNRLVHFVVRTLKELLWPALGAIALAAALAYGLSAYLTRIVHSLAVRAERIAAGEKDVRLETWTRSEFGALARAFERMRQKLEGKAYVEETVANLSHELKTPLAAIRGAAELLEDGAVNDPAACARFLRNIQQETARLDGIVDGLLQLARLESAPALDPADAPTLDLAAAARELAAGVYAERASRLGVRFSWDVPDAELRCHISAAHFVQLVGNLLDNALHFTPAGQAVRLKLGLDPAAENCARLTVRDAGQGIEPTILPKIFERFFTTKNPRTGARGTGLGLALAASVAQAAGGHIEAHSELGKGSEFVVTLPVLRSAG